MVLNAKSEIRSPTWGKCAVVACPTNREKAQNPSVVVPARTAMGANQRKGGALVDLNGSLRSLSACRTTSEIAKYQN
jgi:hypothetical protein